VPEFSKDEKGWPLRQKRSGPELKAVIARTQSGWWADSASMMIARR
jgi:hypothetical protein